MTRAAATIRATRLIRVHSPTTKEAFAKIGLPLRYLNAGVFRKVYGIRGVDLVVKIPIIGVESKDAIQSAIRHSAQEVSRVKRLYAVKELRPHLPKIYHYDKKSGVIVMRRYEKVSSVDHAEGLGMIITKLVRRICGVKLDDIHSNNIKRKKPDSPDVVFVDLGL